MTSPKKCIGFIFKEHVHHEEGQYYLSYGAGTVHNKEDAHVFSIEEARDTAAKCHGWANKILGKWIAVYG